MTEPAPGPHPTIQAPASLVLFGHPARTATVQVFERPRALRVRRAALFVTLGVVVAPVVAIFPPHAAWLLGALSTGAYFAWRTLSARFAVASVEGACPRCDAPVSVSYGARLRRPHPLQCDACHHELVMKVEEAGLAP